MPNEKKDKIEDRINELEKLIGELEREGTSLEQGIELFEKGIALTRECLDALEQSKGKITELRKHMDELTELPYDPNGE